MNAVLKFLNKPVPLYVVVVSISLAVEATVIIMDYRQTSREILEVVPAENEQLNEIEEQLEQIEEKLDEYQDKDDIDEVRTLIESYREDLIPVAHNVFADHVEHDEPERDYNDWDYAVELPNRTDEEAFIIHREEFGEIDDYEKGVITYYEGDNVFADDKNHIITDPDTLLGPNNLKWGHGSGNPDMVFIRNPFIMCDLEVTRFEGDFSSVYGILHGDGLYLNEHYRVKKHRVYDD